MTRILPIALLNISLAACQPTLDTVAQNGAVCDNEVICDVAVPPVTMWNGKLPPSFQTDRAAIYVQSKCLSFPDHDRAIVIDGTKVIAVLDIESEKLGTFLQSIFRYCPSTVAGPLDSDFRCKAVTSVLRVPCGPRPPGVSIDSVLAVNLMQAIYSNYIQLTETQAAGQLCPKN